MTTHEFAARLHGRQMGHELTAEDIAEAKAAGLVIVYGARDDLIEFRGALWDESPAFGGTQVWLTPEGLFDETSCHDKCVHWQAAWAQVQAHGHSLQAHWDYDVAGEYDLSWSYSTAIPHATFLIYEGAEPYCRGIVFALADTKRTLQGG